MKAALSKRVATAFYGNFRGLHQVQRDTVVPILAGTDVLVISPTASGKTEAVLAPLIDRYCDDLRCHACSILYVSPTRALANDLLRRLEPSLEPLNLKVGIRHGERDDLQRRHSPEIIITTPESLDVLLTKRQRDLRTIRAVVLDEIHLTYNTQRGFQLAVLLRRLETFADRHIQVIGLSATALNAASIWHFFRPKQEFHSIRVPGSRQFNFKIEVVGGFEDLIQVLNRFAADRRKLLVFANSRKDCDSLGAALTGRTVFKNRVYLHHSALHHHIRLRTEREFLANHSAVCIATSTLELGIDIGDIDGVVLFGPPPSWESFLQRIGRGNRRSGAVDVLGIVSPLHGPNLLGTLAFESLVHQVMEDRLENEQAFEVYGAAMQQILSLIVQSNSAYTRVADVAACVEPWNHLPRSIIESMLDSLSRADYLVRHGFLNRFGAGPNLHRLTEDGLLWTNLPGAEASVKLLHGSIELGSVPVRNILRFRAGMVLRFAGRHWRIRRVRRMEIELEPSAAMNAMELSYGRRAARFTSCLVEEILRLIDRGGIDCVHVSNEIRRLVIERIEYYRQFIGWNRIAVAESVQGCQYLTFAGAQFNLLLAQWFGLLSWEADDIVLSTPRPVDFSRLPDDLSEFINRITLPPHDTSSLFEDLLPAELHKQELRSIWLNTPVFSRSLRRLKAARVTRLPFTCLEEFRGASNFQMHR